MAPPLRLAILEADTPVPRARKKYENYTGVFAALFAAAAAPAHLESVARVTGHHVVHDDVPRTPYPALDDVDAVLITGSKHNAYEDQPWILELVGFTRTCLDTARIRVVGVCFGHQIVARALGMKVGVNPKGWEVSVSETELSPAGKEFFGLDKLKIHQMHRDIVFDPADGGRPAGAEVVASNAVCSNQAMYVPKRLISVQGHPEFTSEIVSEILELRHNKGTFPDDVYRGGMDRVNNHHDGILIAKAFLKFCQDQ